MRLLCISDIHGHEDALAAVLATAEKRGYTHLLVAGDLCFPGPAPLAVWRRLVGARAAMVQGLSDSALARLDPQAMKPESDHERRMLQRFTEVRRELGDAVVRALGQLPLTHRMSLPDGRELLLVHGSPADPTQTISHDITDDEVRRLLGDDPADIVVCGGTHVPFDRMVMEVRVINVGSVGEAPGGDAPPSSGPAARPGTHAHAPFAYAPFAHATFIDVPDVSASAAVSRVTSGSGRDRARRAVSNAEANAEANAGANAGASAEAFAEASALVEQIAVPLA